MQLKTKIVSAAVGAVVATAIAGMMVQREVIRQQGISAIHDQMRAAVLGAENTRRVVSGMRQSHSFDEAGLQSKIAGFSDYRKTDLYQTVPVVAAWNSIAAVAAESGFRFRVTAHHPRNPSNAPASADEEEILQALESGGASEYFKVDEGKNEVTYARPIVLTADCLLCHGNPADSPGKNGRDILGFTMEGWRDGDRHGVFLLKSSLSRVDTVVQAGVERTAMWLIPLSLVIGGLVYLLISRLANRVFGLVEKMTKGSGRVRAGVVELERPRERWPRAPANRRRLSKSWNRLRHRASRSPRWPRSAENSRAAAEEMDRVNQNVEAGNKAVADMATSMEEIRTSSGKIARTIRVIDEIAFQTNILALNAAVEAARAGEAGNGLRWSRTKSAVWPSVPRRRRARFRSADR